MPEISAARYRAGDGEPLVLLHGFTGTWRCWLPVLAELVPRFDVFAPTLFGHDGGPPAPTDEPHTVAVATDHLEAQLDQQGIDSAHLVGNSMGGALALELAKRGRARTVVGLAPGGGWRPDSGEAERLIRFFRRQLRLARASAPRLPALLRRPRARRAAFRYVMTRGELMPPAEAVAMVRSSIRCSIVEYVFDALRSGDAVLRDLDQVRCPVLVAWPRHDRILPRGRHAARFQEEIPGAEFRLLEGVGHLPTWDDPRLVVDTIVGFIAGSNSEVGPAEVPAVASASP
jgi:pimeloyl-ACP methyl ester carboxylesterase